MEDERKPNFEVVDLNELSLSEIKTKLTNEIQAGQVLHGTSNPDVIPVLEARRASDVSRDEGRKKAVYATSNPETAIFASIVNKKFITSELKSRIYGWDFRDGHIILKADPNFYELISSRYEEVFSDSLIYVFDMEKFTQSKDSKTEYYSEKDEVPLKTYRIPGKLAKEMFIIGQGEKDTVEKYSEKEMKRINSYIRQQDK